MDRGVTESSRRIERWQLRPGDHIYACHKVPNRPRTNHHHGIYESDDIVFTTRASAELFIPPRTCSVCYEPIRGGDVVVCCLDCFLRGNNNNRPNLCLFAYSVPDSFYFYEVHNSTGLFTPACSNLAEDPPETVLSRAYSRAVCSSFPSYNFPFKQNGLDFAFYCKTGRGNVGGKFVELVVDDDRGVTVFSSRIERRQLRRGDHIYAPRKGRPYSHHGIYESYEKVIHFTSDSEQSSSGFTSFLAFSSSSAFQPCNKCRDAMRRGGVVVCCLNCFLEGDDDLRLFVYSVSEAFYKLRNVGVQDICSMQAEDPPETVLRRANDLHDHGGFGNYHVMHNNCFDFAYYCKTGRPYYLRMELNADPSISPQDQRPHRACTIL